jgi:hypothetical protein
MHENLKRDERLTLPSERNFGFTMAGAFSVLFIAGRFVHGTWNPWLGGIAVFFLAATLIAPASLRGLNKLWMRLGLVLHRIVNPVVLGVLFVFVTLIGVVWRNVKRDPLRLKFNREVGTYWVERVPEGPDRKNFPYQF